MHQLSFILIAIFAVTTLSAQPLVFVSSSGGEGNKGMLVYHLQDGALKPLFASGEVASTNYHNLHPNGQYLYAVGNDLVYAYRLLDRGKLQLINQQPSMHRGPCYVSIDHTGRWAMIANYSGGSVVVYPLGHDGALGDAVGAVMHQGSSVNEQRQKEPHPHLITTCPENKYVLVPDLGTDRIVVYRLDHDSGLLIDHSHGVATPGSGPRHLEFHPHLPFVYVANELLSTVSVYRWQEGKMTPLATYAMLPDDFSGTNSAADIHITSDGRYLYASNRGHNSLAGYSIDSDGLLSPIGWFPTGGELPRNFYITPDDQFVFVANHRSDNIVQFRLDLMSGKLMAVRTYSDIPSAMCIKMKMN